MQIVALVTGANRGIGLEVCRQLAAKGARVVLSARDRAKAEAAAERLRAAGLDVSPATLDVADPSSIRRAARDVAKRFGRVDALVNNAAILVREDAELLSTPLDDLRATFDTNVIGVVAVCQAFVPPMLQRRYGRVVNVSSGAGQLSSMATYAPAYSISKAALNAVTRQLAAATKGRGVLVNAVSPGWVRTEMGGPAAPRTVQQGASSIVWAATLPDTGPTGGFFEDRKAMAW